MDGSCGGRFGLVFQQFLLELAVAVDDLFVQFGVAGGAEAVQERVPGVYAGDGLGAEVVQGWDSRVVRVVVVEHEHAGGGSCGCGCLGFVAGRVLRLAVRMVGVMATATVAGT